MPVALGLMRAKQCRAAAARMDGRRDSRRTGCTGGFAATYSALRSRAAAQVDEAVRPHAGHSGNGQPCMQHATCTLAGRRFTAARTAAHAAKEALRCAVCCAASCMPHGGTVCGTPQARACGAHRRKPHGTAADTVQHPPRGICGVTSCEAHAAWRVRRVSAAARVMAGDAAGGWEYPV